MALLVWLPVFSLTGDVSDLETDKARELPTKLRVVGRQSGSNGAVEPLRVTALESTAR